MANKHGKGKALTILAHKLARAVYDMLKRDTMLARDKVLCGEGEPEPWALIGHPRWLLNLRRWTLKACVGLPLPRA